MEYKKVSINELKPNAYNPNVMQENTLAHLIEEIKRIGFLQPILINKNNIIIDGEHRWKAAKEAGLTEVPVIQVDMDEKDAKITTINMNQIKGSIDPLKFADLLINLEEDFDKEQIQDLLRMNELEIETLKMLKDLPSDFEIEEPKLTAEALIICPLCNGEFKLSDIGHIHKKK